MNEVEVYKIFAKWILAQRAAMVKNKARIVVSYGRTRNKTAKGDYHSVKCVYYKRYAQLVVMRYNMKQVGSICGFFMNTPL